MSATVRSSQKKGAQSGRSFAKRYAPRSRTGCVTCRYEATNPKVDSSSLLIGYLESVVSSVTKPGHPVTDAPLQDANVTATLNPPTLNTGDHHTKAWLLVAWD